jgi:hypothetical protein
MPELPGPPNEVSVRVQGFLCLFLIFFYPTTDEYSGENLTRNDNDGWRIGRGILAGKPRESD